MDGAVNMMDRLAQNARRCVERNLTTEARRLLEKLLTYPDLPIHHRIDAHRSLAQIDLDAERYNQARRHLSMALILQPRSAEAHYELALAIDADPRANVKRAYVLLKRAVGLVDTDPAFWAALGGVAMQLNKDVAARKAYRRCLECEPTDVATIREAIEALELLGRVRFAERHLRLAHFRLGRNPEMAQLVRDWKLRRLEAEDEAWKTMTPMVLPFREPALVEAGDGDDSEPVIYRLDRSSRPTPHGVGRQYRPDPG
jgi:tetratricopeptide (TPR) repeat protein